MAHQPKALIYIEFKFKNEAVPSFQHMNECALTWLTEWHGEMLLHHILGVRVWRRSWLGGLELRNIDMRNFNTIWTVRSWEA
jgi:hypothetical protein